MVNKTRGLETRMRKNEIREEYRARRAALTAEEKRAWDARICTLFLSSITYRYAKAILMYAPLAGEIDIMPIAVRALADGKTVAFPRCDSNACTMQYHVVTDVGDLQPGAYGILEPSPSLPVFHTDACTPDMHPVCIVPGIVFDRLGFRVGYGKGYYDRYLGTFPGVRVGAVYSAFLLPELPRGRFDLAVDVLVTEKGVRAVHAN